MDITDKDKLEVFVSSLGQYIWRMGRVRESTWQSQIWEVFRIGCIAGHWKKRMEKFNLNGRNWDTGRKEKTFK